MTDYNIRTTCRLCNSSQLELVLDLGETALANEVWDDPNEQQDTFPLRLVQCGECGHMQNPVVVDPERLFRKYTYTSGLTEAYREHLEGHARQIADEMVITADQLVVEIGGNDGSLKISDGVFSGCDYINVDPSDVDQKFGKRIREFFTSDLARRIRSEHGPAKAIVANHVFAHVDDLHDMAEGVRELLADDGTFWCEVGHGPTQLNSGCLDVIYHEHLSFHDEYSFRAFWKEHGFKMVGLEFNEAQGGSMRCQLVKGNPGRLSNLDVFNLPCIKAAAGHLAGLGDLLRVVQLASGDYMDGYLGVYGAPAKLTTLLALTGFDKCGHPPSVVFDDSPRKQGRFTSGSHIPISAPLPAPMSGCEFMLIASWNFADDIIARFPEYRGTWIVPLPEVRFVKGCGA